MTVPDVVTAYELVQLEGQIFGKEGGSTGEHIASLLRDSVDAAMPHVERSVGNNSLLKQYYMIMLGDLGRRMLKFVAVPPVDTAVPTTALKRRRELMEPGAQTPLSNPPSSSAKKIKKYNAPRGSEYSPASQTYKGGVKVYGKYIALPTTKDADSFVKWRNEVLEIQKNFTNKDEAIAKAKQYVRELKTVLVGPISSASTEASTGPTSPVSGDATTLTPAKIAAAASRKLSLTSSPRTAPHRVSLAPSDIDILRFRDKFYCRVSVFGEFISTSMRLSRFEAENDMERLSKKLKTFSAYFRNPLVNQFKKNQVVEDIKAFVQTLDGTSSQEPRVPQTDVKQKGGMDISGTPSVSSVALPRGVYRMRDKYYSSVVMFGQTFSTPMRDTIVEVVDDRAAFTEEMQKHAPDLTPDAKTKLIEHVKQLLNERLMGDDFKTPKKSHN